MSNPGWLRITGAEFEQSYRPFFVEAGLEAQKSLCNNDHCGAVIVSTDGLVIGRGFSGPPDGLESMRMCDVTSTLPHTRKPKSDITCCTHAEVEAVMDAQVHNPHKLAGATMFFARVDMQSGEITDSNNEPYCTLCSRVTLSALGSLGKFALYGEDGAYVYGLPEYNLASYRFHEK